ncbi:MAG: hypothetical protein HY367_02640 [Candidatus Aenigmarchaeota archaeon]|nr:hypothetical protein [Candidatus Aenigmarchaeota archaeon]
MAFDIYTFGIPFLFMLAVVYGAMEVSGVFKKNAVKVIIALVIAIFAATYEPAVAFIFQALPFATLFFIGAFFLGFIATLFREKGDAKDWPLLVIVFGLFLILLTQFEDVLQIKAFGLDGQTILIGTGLVVILMVFYAVYKISTQ